MDEQEFRKHVRSLGYAEPHLIELGPGNPGALLSYDVSTIGPVVRGSVTLEFESTCIVNMPGEF